MASEQPLPGLVARKSHSVQGNAETEPARLIVASGHASGGRVRRRASVLLRSQCQLIVGSCVFPGFFSRIPGSSARYSGFAKRVEAVSPPFVDGESELSVEIYTLRTLKAPGLKGSGGGPLQVSSQKFLHFPQ